MKKELVVFGVMITMDSLMLLLSFPKNKQNKPLFETETVISRELFLLSVILQDRADAH